MGFNILNFLENDLEKSSIPDGTPVHKWHQLKLSTVCRVISCAVIMTRLRQTTQLSKCLQNMQGLSRGLVQRAKRYRDNNFLDTYNAQV